jgi:hypothetical protein
MRRLWSKKQPPRTVYVGSHEDNLSRLAPIHAVPTTAPGERTWKDTKAPSISRCRCRASSSRVAVGRSGTKPRGGLAPSEPGTRP